MRVKKGIQLAVVLAASLLYAIQMTACTSKEAEIDKKKQSVSVDAEKKTVKGQGEIEVETISAERISDGKYAYENLGQKEKEAYNQILSAILKHQDKVRLSNKDPDEMKKAYTAVCEDYGGLFWVDGYIFTKYTMGEQVVGLEFSPKYTMTEAQRQSVQAQIDAVVDEWLGGISINDSDYDKAKYVYKLLADNIEYMEGAQNSQNIISIFLNRMSVCQGYASAVQYLLGQLGIQSAIVSGTALGVPHAWNLIQLDGDYYYMDATWGRSEYTDDAMNQVFFTDYNYMNMTTAEMLIDHVPDENLILPECVAVANNYFVKEGNYMEEWELDKIGERISQFWNQKEILTLRFSDAAIYQQVLQYFIEEGNISEYCDGINEISYIENPVWNEISFCF